MASILSWLTNPIIRASDNLKQRYDPFLRAFTQYTGGKYTTYDAKGETYVNEGYNKNADVFSVINQIATKASNIPFTIKKVKNKDSQKQLERLRKSHNGVVTGIMKIKEAILMNKTYEEVELELPMERPNFYQSWEEFIALTETMLNLNGNFYWYIQSPDDGRNKGVPNQIYVLPSHLIQIELEDNWSEAMNQFAASEYYNPIKRYTLIENAYYVEFPADNVIHGKFPNPNYDQNGEHFYGMSPLRPLIKELQMHNAGLENGVKTLLSGGAFGLIHGKQIPLEQTEAAQLKERLKEMDADPSRLGRWAGISQEVGFTRLSLTTEELKPFEYLKYTQKAICNALGWSDKLMNNDDGAKYDNMLTEYRRVIQNKVMPDLKIICAAINDSLLPRFQGYEGAYWEFDPSELPEMQEDMEKLANWAIKFKQEAILTGNEVREIANFPISDVPEMNIFTTRIGTTSLEDALAEPDLSNIINDPNNPDNNQDDDEDDE